MNKSNRSAFLHRATALSKAVSFALVLCLPMSCGNLSDDCTYVRTCAGDEGGEGGTGGVSMSGGNTQGGQIWSMGVEGGRGADADADEGGEVGISGASGASGAGGEGGAPSACDTTKSPSVETCVATDAHAVFVAPTGADSADGSRANPLKSITKALALAEVSGKAVIACNGRFDEHVSVTVGARLYGGFACPTEKVPWRYQRGRRAQVVPSDEGTALEIRNVADAVTIEDVEFYSRDATTPSGSSIAAIVEGSNDVRLARIRILAGGAMAGEDGISGANGADGYAVISQQRGNDAICGRQAPEIDFGGNWLANSACGSRGGSGGPSDKGYFGFPGSAGLPRSNVLAQSAADLENGGDEGREGGNGKPGAPGLSGARGQAADDATFTALGFTPALAGGAGTDGFPGQGGGGGGASNATGECIGASGGAGGMGGCGGKGGTGGSAGGGSVALLVWSSALTLDACELIAQEGGNGGKGGDGGLGGLGKDGGIGGAAFSDGSNSVGKGGNGGPGGNGGAGGPGAGGNGGPSIALVVHGIAPEGVASSVLTAGIAGEAGPGGSAGALAGVDGKAGIASAQLSVP